MRKLFLFFFVLLLLVPFIDAAKATQTFSGDVGLELRIPPAEFVKQNTAIQSNIYVYNKSSGIIMTNETTSCIAHLYNLTGRQILAQDMEYNDDNDDFFVEVDKNNFSDLGFISFIIQCNTSNEGGFVSGSVEVTPEGKAMEDYSNFSFAIVAIIFLFVTILVVVGLFKSEAIWLKVILTVALSLMLTTILRFTSWFISITNPAETALIGTLDFFYSIGVRAMYFLVAGACIFLVVFIINGIRDMPRKRRKNDWESWGKDDNE